MLTASHLTRRFGSRLAVDDVSFELVPGEVFALLGPNGAGKTTTLRMLAGLIEPSSGSVRFKADTMSPQTAPRLRGQIGFLTEAPGLWERLDVRRNLLVYARLHGLPKPNQAVSQALETFGLLDRANDIAGQLSKGLKQRVALARTLLHKPSVVLLDEPTAGLDPESAREVRELVLRLRETQNTIVISTHNLDEVDRIASRVAVLRTRLIASRHTCGTSGSSVRHSPAHHAWSGGRAIRQYTDRQRVRRCPRRRAGTLDRSEQGTVVGSSDREKPRPSRRGRFLCPRGRATPRGRLPPAPRERGSERINDDERTAGRMTRILALLDKDVADLRQNPSLLIPAVLTGLFSLLLPFVIAIIIPVFADERLSDSSDFEIVVETYKNQPAMRGLDPEGTIQAWIFQHFLVLLVLTPIAGSMSVAAHSVIGEKQARTLEPLLATPITTFELLAAKVLGSLLPALLLTAICFSVYVAGVVIFAQPGVYRALFTPASLGIVFLLGPLASLAALQLAVCVSSRVNDPRSAQQIGVLVILPIAGLLVVQLTGSFALTGPVIMFIALALLGVNTGLMLLGIRLFDREAILTRWK